MYHLDFNIHIIKMRLLKIFIILNQQYISLTIFVLVSSFLILLGGYNFSLISFISTYSYGSLDVLFSATSWSVSLFRIFDLD